MYMASILLPALIAGCEFKPVEEARFPVEFAEAQCMIYKKCYRMYFDGEFEVMEQCALQIQQVWRSKVLRRKIEIAQYKARMDRAGLQPRQSTGPRLLGGFARVKDFIKAAKAMNEPLTENQRLECMELNQRQMMESLARLQESLNELAHSHDLYRDAPSFQ